MTTNLRKAVTIATRYSCVRRQSELKPGLVFRVYLLRDVYSFLKNLGIASLRSWTTRLNKINYCHHWQLLLHSN